MKAKPHSKARQPSLPIAHIVLTVAILGASSALLLARLGHYALWDDEAGLVPIAEQVWRTGDTSAVIGHNILATHNGVLLRNLHDRGNPPLPAFLIAPFIGIGKSPWVARFPLALCGIGCVSLILWWMRKSRLSLRIWAVVTIGLLGNVSF